MNVKKNIGILLIVLSTLYMVGIGWGMGWWSASTYRTMSLAEISHTVWTIHHPLFWVWAMSIPFGAILAGIGLLFFVNAKGTRIFLIGSGLLLAGFFIQLIPQKPHFPPVFGIFGGVILALFLLTVWMWAKKRDTLEDKAKGIADLQLVGYVFFIIAMWFLCGAFGRQFFPALSSIKLNSPVQIIVYLALGWFFIFLSQYKEVKFLKSK